MRTTSVAVLLMAALVLPACGDGADGPTRAEFIAKADAQCKVSNARTKTLNEEAARVAETARGEQDLLRELAPILERGYVQLRANATAFKEVAPPAADATEVGRLRELYDEQAEIVRKLGLASKRGDIEPYKALFEEQKDVVARTRAAAKAFGFKECGSTKSDAA